MSRAAAFGVAAPRLEIIRAPREASGAENVVNLSAHRASVAAKKAAGLLYAALGVGPASPAPTRKGDR